MPKGCLTAITTCTDASRDEEFNRWYSHTHLPDLLRMESCIGARRYREVGDRSPKRYMAMYELEAVDLDAARKELVGLAVKAFELGRHIDCIAGHPSPDYLVLWEEIESDAYRPLEIVNYSNEDEAIGRSLAASF
jgi:hypothetical protein